MDWYRQIQFVAAVAMPDEIATAYGTTVNGMWADPEALVEPRRCRRRARRGRRVLFSVPMIALTPGRLRGAPTSSLLRDEICLDVDGLPVGVRLVLLGVEAGLRRVHLQRGRSGTT